LVFYYSTITMMHGPLSIRSFSEFMNVEFLNFACRVLLIRFVVFINAPEDWNTVYIVRGYRIEDVILIIPDA